ncbi:hypothetical protein [Pseudobacteriovorax antillogorgiicola]|uniref:Uncharacterized protein n=1 Tax=Pseudobacteriovorax antillogorgiicola TaxID=1513793 RepID=A0A1Y6CMB6_9BACT|nr:hypothetical protein [Pseudobacteriovorax antillogorgiicola]TCS45449.1 hypothetical protein EDD56_12860 [Pseudobacteriovorax antillogorgiicola]SMF74656.1 hypothetical protein SAMN06296036_12860 [Pseudobacteriovorax antillogorgiicola]
MRLSTVSLVAILMAMFGCETQSFEYEMKPGTATSGDATPAQDSSDNTQSADNTADETPVADEAEEEEAVEETPVVEAPTPLTNADLLAMDTVVVTAFVAADDSVVFKSDVGATKVTAAGDISNAAVINAIGDMDQNNLLQIKAGQKLVFCNHASSDANARLRIHAQGGVFDHWGGAQQLDAGQCSFNLGYPEVIGAAAVGRAPGDLYNHNGNENGSTVFVEYIQ